MEIILKQDVLNLGSADDIVKVKNGYGRNFLIPMGYASLATENAKKIHQENLKQRAHKEEKIKEEALKLAKSLEATNIQIGAKTSSTGKIFGSVNTIQLAEAISKLGFDIDRKRIAIIEDNVKEVGKYTARIKLHRDVTIEMPFEVVSE